MAKKDTTNNTKEENKSKANNDDAAAAANKVKSQIPKEKKEKVLTPKQLEKKAAQEKAKRKEQNRRLKYQMMFEADKKITRKRFEEKRANKKKIIINACILIAGLGASAFLMTLQQYLVAVALPIAVFSIFNIVRAILTLRKLPNPYEIRKMLILENAKKMHLDRNKRIIEAYKEEKRKFKMLKNLPYKILNGMALMIAMFTIILFFFILDLGIAKTALILFGIFFVTYFVVGVLMIGVFYLVSENKQRLIKFQLEQEREKLLMEEKLRNEESIRNKLSAERRRYEEEERLRIEEQQRVAKEQEQERLLREEERRLIEEAEEERQKLIKESKFIRAEATLSISKAEFASQSEVVRNEMDKNMINDIRKLSNVVNISGIEDFSENNDFNSIGPIFHDIDVSDDTINTEFDNATPVSLRYQKEEDFLADVTDIEEAKTLVFEQALQKSNRSVNRENIPAPVNPPISDKPTTNQGKSVSGKSFMILRDMIKDG